MIDLEFLEGETYSTMLDIAWGEFKRDMNCEEYGIAEQLFCILIGLA